MRRQLTYLHTSGAEPIAALRPSEAAIYGRYGYGPATQGARLRCDKRAVRFRPGTDFGDGTIRLQERGGASASRFALHHDADGRTTGYALYRIKQDASGGDGNALWGVELATASRQAYAALWRFLAGIDLVSWIEYERAVDEPPAHLLTDPRAARSTPVDRLWVRLIDVDRALAARRYAGTLDLVLDVEDAFCPWNTGRYWLEADQDAAACVRTRAPADLRLTAAELGEAFLGCTTLASLAGAGLVEELRAGALPRATAAFRADREPFYPGGWAFPAF
ncbi:sterol carrier protein domain-containing protein [Streptomyces prunicolor]